MAFNTSAIARILLPLLCQCCFDKTTLVFQLVSGLNVVPQSFPASTRQALIERSKLINSEPYSPAGWSNRAATVLTPVTLDGIYTADRPFYWNNIDVGCRATIIELPNETNKPDLWIHSPVNLDGPMIRSLENIGTVRTVVTPNYEHTKFAAAWYQNYKPTMIGCPGLAERLTNIPWDAEIPVGYRPPGWKAGSRSVESQKFDEKAYWDMNVLQCIQINVEKNPFTGRPFFNEVVFFHVPSKTLLATDLYWNYPASGTPNEEFGRDDTWELAPKLPKVPFGSRAWKFGMDNIYSPFYSTFMVTDASEYQTIADHIVNVWQPETVVPAHGDILRGKDVIRPILREFFGLKK